MRYSGLFLLFFILLFSCGQENNKINLVVFPDYCGGCVSRNFHALKNINTEDKFNVYFDTSDLFILDAAKLNNLKFTHIDNSKIHAKFGDYANIVLFTPGKEPTELKTNEIVEKGKHY